MSTYLELECDKYRAKSKNHNVSFHTPSSFEDNTNNELELLLLELNFEFQVSTS